MYKYTCMYMFVYYVCAHVNMYVCSYASPHVRMYIDLFVCMCDCMLLVFFYIKKKIILHKNN